MIACALYPIALSLHRVSAESLTQSLAGLGVDSGVDLDTLWRGSELVDDALGDVPVPPLSPRVAVRAAEHSLPAGLVAELDANLRAHGFSDRLDEVLDGAHRAAARMRLAAARIADRPDSRVAGRSPRALGAALADRRGRAPRPHRRAFWLAAGGDRPGRPAGGEADRRRRAPRGRRRSSWTTSATRPTGLRRATRSCSCSRSSERRPSPFCARSAAAARTPRAWRGPGSSRAKRSGSAS